MYQLDEHFISTAEFKYIRKQILWNYVLCRLKRYKFDYVRKDIYYSYLFIIIYVPFQLYLIYFRVLNM